MKVLIALLLGSGLIFANTQTSDLTSEIPQVEESVEVSENQAVEGSNEAVEPSSSEEVVESEKVSEEISGSVENSEEIVPTFEPTKYTYTEEETGNRLEFITESNYVGTFKIYENGKLTFIKKVGYSRAETTFNFLKSDGTLYKISFDEETKTITLDKDEKIFGIYEPIEEEQELTDAQKLYEFITNELTRLGLNGIVTLLTTIAGIIVMFFKLRKETRCAVDTLKGTNDSTEKQNKTIDTLVNQLEAQNKQHSEEIETLKATYEEQLKAKDKEIEEIKVIANNMKKLNNIPQAISLLTSSLPEMTKSGVAKQVADTLGLNDDNVIDANKTENI